MQRHHYYQNKMKDYYQNMNKKVIYTATFPHQNNMDYILFEPEVIPDGYDFVCFTNIVTNQSDKMHIFSHAGASTS